MSNEPCTPEDLGPEDRTVLLRKEGEREEENLPSVRDSGGVHEEGVSEEASIRDANAASKRLISALFVLHDMKFEDGPLAGGTDYTNEMPLYREHTNWHDGEWHAMTYRRHRIENQGDRYVVYYRIIHHKIIPQEAIDA